jgi:hypothetical protein
MLTKLFIFFFAFISFGNFRVTQMYFTLDGQFEAKTGDFKDLPKRPHAL